MSDAALSQLQQKFTLMVAKLILWAYEQPGYGLTFGEALRTPAQAQTYAAQGRGIDHSLHCIKLAIDLNLWINGVYQTETEAYTPLGEYWESLGGAWGGRFQKPAVPDGNHFSLAYGGRK